MSNVVQMRPKENQVEFGTVHGIKVPKPKTGQDYLALCKCFLKDGDYEDILCAIMDKEIYATIEPQLQRIVECYFDFPK